MSSLPDRLRLLAQAVWQIYLRPRLQPKTLSAAAVAVALFVFLARQSRPKKLEGGSATERSLLTKKQQEEEEKKLKKKKKPTFTFKEFIPQCKRLLKIVLPGVWSREFGLLTMHTLTLVARTLLSVAVVNFQGALAKTIVDRDARGFSWELFKWIALAVPATYVNAMIRFLEKKLSIAFRTRLVKHIYNLYMNNETYYRVENLDTRLSNADQCLTEDAAKFCENLSHLWSQLSKPALDFIVLTGQLIYMYHQQQGKTGGGGGGGIAGVLGIGTIILTGYFLRTISPPFSKYVAHQAKLEGELRFMHSRVITNAEEIAFYGGHAIEKSLLDLAYERLVKHMNFLFRSRILYNTVEGFLMKYVWSAAGLLMIAVPTFMRPEKKNAQGATVEADTVSERTENFMVAQGLLIGVADAVERILSSYKEMTELAGYTSRVADMLYVFEEVREGRYVKGQSTENQANRPAPGTARPQVMESSDCVEFKDVPIVTPAGDLLVPKLSFRIERGQSLLIAGPNGCGKSSLFRTLGGLWPVYGGTLIKPHKHELFYIPQRPYLSIGTLRDQVIYPDTRAQMESKGITDANLDELMDAVNLRHVVEREGGWDVDKTDWQDVLSGGEKQRLAMSRLFYHRPKFAILDECTSAVSFDVEGKMYTYATQTVGITLLTVSHRPSLWKYHDYILQFDGAGGYTFNKLEHKDKEAPVLSVTGSLREERLALENDLLQIPKKMQRLQELEVSLGEESVQMRKIEGQLAKLRLDRTTTASITSPAAALGAGVGEFEDGSRPITPE